MKLGCITKHQKQNHVHNFGEDGDVMESGPTITTFSIMFFSIAEAAASHFKTSGDGRATKVIMLRVTAQAVANNQKFFSHQTDDPEFTT